MIKKISLIGPECTAKTTLASELARHFGTMWIPEYAREYIENLDHKYTFQDVEHIAQKQLSQINSTYPQANNWIFFDTDLIITKVWFEVVFNNCPEWINEEIKKKHFALHLLCKPDIPWVADKVRENGGKNREILYFRYLDILQNYKLPYGIVEGEEKMRFSNAIVLLNNL
ncbi:MAG TPA: ATP-binding protein [Bacteroidales bacterium]|nr:ATP-binding protein [Bacteroidales bacterium]